MSHLTPPPSESANIALVRKLVLLTLWMIVASMALVALLMWIKMASPMLALVLTNAVLGLAAGLSVRWTLRKRTSALRLSSALAFVVGSLLMIGWFTAGRAGINVPSTSPAGIDWSGLGQLLLAAGVAFLALYGWQEGQLTIAPAPQPRTAKRPARSRLRPTNRPRRKAASKSNVRAVARSRIQGAAAAPPQPAKVKSKPRRISRRKLQLKLSGEEEHRCPYCLELIEPNDPRGVVECKVCHTLHHADCWAITGTCQVPHYTT